jgi:hypothetical protein
MLPILNWLSPAGAWRVLSEGLDEAGHIKNLAQNSWHGQFGEGGTSLGQKLKTGYWGMRSAFTKPGHPETAYRDLRAQGYSKTAAKEKIGVSELVRNALTPGAKENFAKYDKVRPVTPGKAYKYFTSSAGAHITNSFAPSWNMTKGALRDATGVAFFQGSYHKLRSGLYKKGTYQRYYHEMRAGGQTGEIAGKFAADKMRFATQYSKAQRLSPLGNKAIAASPLEIAGVAMSPKTGAILSKRRLAFEGKNIFRQGYLMGGIIAAQAMDQTFSNPFGPIYGAGVSAAFWGAGAPAMRMGWGAGSALGAKMGQAAIRGIGADAIGASAFRAGVGSLMKGGMKVATGGLLAGILTIAVPEVIQWAANSIPPVGHRMRRKGFGNFYGPYKDNPAVATMRQQALAAMSQSQMNARNALGGEAALMHLT